jgi:hypothetical protein
MVVIRIHVCPWELGGTVFAGCSLLPAGEGIVPDHRPRPGAGFQRPLAAARWVRRRAGTPIPSPVGCVTRPRLGAPEKSAAGKTKVTKGSVKDVPARWFYCWRFAYGCAPAFGRMELIYFRTYPGFRFLRSLHPGLRLCRPAGWTVEAQVIAQKRGANPSTGLRAGSGAPGRPAIRPPARCSGQVAEFAGVLDDAGGVLMVVPPG